jgi:8-oxo-dGTP pyrophosphatase MutT (NUDIX family)
LSLAAPAASLFGATPEELGMGGSLSGVDRSRLSSLTIEPRLAAAGWKMAFLSEEIDEPDTIYHEGLNASLSDGAPMPFVMSVRPFEPDDAWMLDRRVSQMRAEGRNIFDSIKIRMASDPAAGHAVALEPTSYFNGLVTNEFCLREYQACDGLSVDGTERAFPLSMVPKLSRSRMSNHIGATSLAFDDDGRLCLCVTGSAAAVAAGKITSSAAGSIDMADIAGASSLTQAVADAITRELVEETGLDKAVAVESRIIAFVRHLERGGKPEFIAVSRIRGRWADVGNSIDDAERPFTEGHVVLDAAALGLDGVGRWLAEQSGHTSYALRSAWEFLFHAHARQNSALPGWVGISTV